MAEHRGKMLLWNCVPSLAKRKIRFLLGVPCIPVRKSRSIWVSGLREVRPIALNDLPEFVIRRSKWQPTEAARLERTEYIRKFQRMEGPKLCLTLSPEPSDQICKRKLAAPRSW